MNSICNVNLLSSHSLTETKLSNIYFLYILYSCIVNIIGLDRLRVRFPNL